MASFRDPAQNFSPIEVLERLLEITEFFGGKPRLYIASDEDIATYLDSFGFDVYSLTNNTNRRFDAGGRSTLVFPSGSHSHDSITAH